MPYFFQIILKKPSLVAINSPSKKVESFLTYLRQSCATDIRTCFCYFEGFLETSLYKSSSFTNPQQKSFNFVVNIQFICQHLILNKNVHRLNVVVSLHFNHPLLCGTSVTFSRPFLNSFRALLLALLLNILIAFIKRLLRRLAEFYIKLDHIPQLNITSFHFRDIHHKNQLEQQLQK